MSRRPHDLIGSDIRASVLAWLREQDAVMAQLRVEARRHGLPAAEFDAHMRREVADRLDARVTASIAAINLGKSIPAT